jgi:DNA-binding ferritin-like protein
MNEDISAVRRTVQLTAGTIGMTRTDLQRADDLLQRYGDERERLFGEMIALLGKADTSSIRDEWRSRCDKAADLLDRLDREMPTTLAGQGLRAVGAGNFAEGEKRAWAKNHDADVASVADIINQLYRADLEVINRCNEQLKTVRDDDHAVQALIEQNFGSVRTSLKNVAMTIVSKAVPATFSIFAKDATTKQLIRDWGRDFTKSMQDYLQAAKQKGTFKKIILQNIQLIQSARDQLSEQWIEEVYKKGEEAARSLRDAGARDDYKAADWQAFGEQCIRPLAERRDGAKEQSRKVFGELLPTFQEQNNRAFAAVTSDPSALADWRSSMQTDFSSIDEALAKGDDIIGELAEGPYKQAARETLEELRNSITAGAKLFLETNSRADEEMRQ